MSARRYLESPERCACGLPPVNWITIEGGLKLYQLACDACGLRTGASDDYADAVFEWNDGRMAPAEDGGLRMADGAAVAPAAGTISRRGDVAAGPIKES